MLGVAVFNFALAMTVPSWMNEKRAHVSAPAVVWSGSACAVVTFVVVGGLGAAALSDPPDDLLKELASDAMPPITRLSAFLFGVIIIGLGVPVNCLVVRYNLLVARVLRPRAAAFCSALLPWLVSWPLYQGHAALDLVSWSGTVVNGLVNQILPLLLALAAAGALGAGLPPLAPPSASLVRALPPACEPRRTWVLWALLALALPAIAWATAAKTWVALNDHHRPALVPVHPDHQPPHG